MRPRIHDRYLLVQFTRIFFYAVLAFVIIYITVNTFEEIDNFIDHDAHIWDVTRYYFLSIPFVLTYVVPVSLLLATVFSMGILARRNELMAFIASGLSLLRIAGPIIVFAISVSVVSIFFNDIVATKASRMAEDVKHYDIEGRERRDPSQVENLHYLADDGYIYLARRYDYNTTTMYDVVVQQFDGSTLVRRIDAKRAQFHGDRWVFYSGFDRHFRDGDEMVSAFDTLPVPELNEDPSVFTQEQIAQENMNFFELSKDIDKIRKSGGTVERPLTDLYFKLSYPLAGAIFVLLGISFASGKRKQSMATGFGLTLLIAFTYYGVLRVGQTLGYNGVLPAPLAAQLGNLIFLIIGVVLLRRANQ